MVVWLAARAEAAQVASVRLAVQALRTWAVVVVVVQMVTQALTAAAEL